MFQDRLVSDEDRKWFDQLLNTHIQEFGCKIEKVVPYQPVLYGDFMLPGSVKIYQIIEDKEKVNGAYIALHLFGYILVALATEMNDTSN